MNWRMVVNCLLGVALGLAIIAAAVNDRLAEQINELQKDVQQLQRAASGGAR